MVGRGQEDDDAIGPGATAGMVIPGCLVCHLCTCLRHLSCPIPLNEGWVWLVWCDQDKWFYFLSGSGCSDQAHQLSPMASKWLHNLPALLSPFLFLNIFLPHLYQSLSVPWAYKLLLFTLSPLFPALLHPYPNLIFLTLLPDWPWRYLALEALLPHCCWPWAIVLPVGPQGSLEGSVRISPFPCNSPSTPVRSRRPSPRCLWLLPVMSNCFLFLAESA